MFYSYFERKIDKGLKFKIDVFANMKKVPPSSKRCPQLKKCLRAY